MIVCDSYKGKRVAVFGLGKSGLSSARSLRAGGADVLAWDDGVEAREAAAAEGIALVDLRTAAWHDIAALVLAPGVPLTHPEPHEVVRLAQRLDVPIIGDVELLAQAVAERRGNGWPRIVAITGTNGKSTTTALTAHILKCCGLDAHACGNIGMPVLDLPEPSARTVFVIEMSSYQLDLTQSLAADVAILLNITPDHLDRHGDMDGYVTAKRRVFRGQPPTATAVIGVDDRYGQQICTDIAARHEQTVIPVSVGKALGRGFYVIDGVLYDGVSVPSGTVIDLKRAESLPGAHNWQNAAAAFAAGQALTGNAKGLAQALLAARGRGPRLQNIARIGAVRFVHDSRATNADATSHALSAFERIYWIAGGRAKDGGIESLTDHLDHVVKAYLIGEAAEAFATSLEGRVPSELCGTMARAVEAAAADAASDSHSDPVVVLSPACASFDQYRNFELRGNDFVACVQALKDRSGSNGSAAGESAA